MGRRAAILGVMAVVLTGCQTPPPKHVDPPVDPIAERLSKAALDASSALKTLAEVEQIRMPPPDLPLLDDTAIPEELKRTISVTWSGPVGPLVRRLAIRADYLFVSVGTDPRAALIVNIDAHDRSLVDVLRDVGLQAGQRADLVIDTEHKKIEIRYAPAS